MFYVFLSHDNKDIKLVERIWKILTNIKMNPYIYEKFPAYGEYIPERIRRIIKESSYFVVFLTRNGVKSQWVNQEIGIAHAYEKLIIPINESEVKSKGFVELREHIDYIPSKPYEMIFKLITRLRDLLFMSYEIKHGLKVECPNCEKRFETDLPSAEDVNHAVEKDSVFKLKCQNCKEKIELSPHTFEPITEREFIIEL